MKKDILGAGIIYSIQKRQVKFVLIQDRFNKWTFPKGKCERGEKIENTALRECSEETGLKDLKIIKHLDTIKYQADNKQKIVYLYLIKSLDPNEKFSTDVTEGIKQIAWKSSSDVLNLTDYENFISCFKKALKYLY